MSVVQLRAADTATDTIWQATAAIRPLLLSLSLLLLGNGLQNILLPLRAAREGMDSGTIGLVFSAYFASFIAACFIGPRIIRRIGHARTFAAGVAVFAAAGIAYAFLVDPLVWAALRAVSGFASAILFMTIESWFNEASSNANRGRILSVYRIVDLATSTGGQFLIGLADPGSFALFGLFAILLGISGLPVLLSTRPGPGPVGLVTLRPLALWRAAPAGTAGCLSVGFTNGALWSLAPVYAADFGMDPTGTAVFMSAIIAGGALTQWPLGWCSDRIGRRGVLAAALLGASACGAGLFLLPGAEPGVLICAAALFGAASMPHYTLSLAVVNDRVASTDFVSTAASLLMLYGIGATFGPFLAGGLMNLLGPQALFLHTAVAHAATGLFVLYRLLRRPPPPRTALP